MGDMADFINSEQVEHCYDDFGGMRTKTCWSCGEHGLKWVSTNSGWRLFCGDKQHKCDPDKGGRKR